MLGRLLVKETPEGTVSGWIVETEAYLGVIDEAAHSFNGKNTPRLKSMYEEAGTIYVYQMHTHQMLNLVVKEEGNPEAVLIRGIEPLMGLELMETRRGKTGIEVSNGPGKLTKAFAINQTDEGSKIYEKPLYIAKEKEKSQCLLMYHHESVFLIKVNGQRHPCVIVLQEILMSLNVEEK